MPSLYRQFDAQGNLLYIGMAQSLAERVRGHEGQSPWFKLVTRIDVEHFDDLNEAKRAEAAAISSEAPLFNVQHVKPLRYGSDRVSVKGRKIGRRPKHSYSLEQAEAILRQYYSPGPLVDVAAFADKVLGVDPGTIRGHWVKMLARKYTGHAKRTPPEGWDGILVDADGKPVHPEGNSGE